MRKLEEEREFMDKPMNIRLIYIPLRSLRVVNITNNSCNLNPARKG